MLLSSPLQRHFFNFPFMFSLYDCGFLHRMCRYRLWQSNSPEHPSPGRSARRAAAVCGRAHSVLPGGDLPDAHLRQLSGEMETRNTPCLLCLYTFDLNIAPLNRNPSQLVFTSLSNQQSLPLKVTLCWMDPTNAVFSAKLLLPDIDLVVERTGGDIWYGNKEPGDERNNVEQVSAVL